jgi:hypothetical protein
MRFNMVLAMVLIPQTSPLLLGGLAWEAAEMRGLRRWRLFEALLANPNHSLQSLAAAIDLAPRAPPRRGALRPRLARALAANPLIPLWLLDDPQALGRLLRGPFLRLCHSRVFVERWGYALVAAIDGEAHASTRPGLWIAHPGIEALWRHGHEPTRAALRAARSAPVRSYAERLDGKHVAPSVIWLALTGPSPLTADQLDVINRYLASP